MSPRETTTPRATAFSQLLVGSTGQRKSSLRGSKEKLVRVTSPLTPWEDTLFKKRKSSLKGNSRQLKALKSNLKENKKKSKKEIDKPFEIKFRSENGKPKVGGSFCHHVDIDKYIKEYKEERRAKLREENSGYDEYGPDDIAKTYESLGIPKISVPRISRLSNISRRNFLPPVQDHEVEQENNDINSETTPLICESEGESEDEIENEISSPEARERRNNLNLSPLRKHVRLPDMSNFPVQTVSGINLLELARLATARAENTDARHKQGTATALSRTKFSSSEKKVLATSINLQEKVMCRVVELSLPNNTEFQLPMPKSSKNQKEILEKSPASLDKYSHHSEDEKEILNSIIKKAQIAHEKLKKLNLGDPQEDALAVAIGTSRSCQSSVLSHTVSSLSPNSSSSLNHSPTVKELLTAAVKDLHSSKPNCLQPQTNETNQQMQKLATSHEIEFNPEKSKENSGKQFVSQKTNRKLSNKLAMRKYIEGLYRTTDEKKSTQNKQSCLIKGKTLQKPKEIVESPLPMLSISPTKSSPKDTKEVDIATANRFSPKSDSAKLRKRARQRQEAAEKYKQFKRAITLDGTKQRDSKLAIISKCHTVVKPQVSLKTVAI